ncbi:ABC transporter substrate-binding protein [Halalkalibacter krulwichiae]|uniref:Putative thiamine biosynthesis protein n=1 Tax=Halalkalibacter krulwichiae TaxID=199441 RepID=A0A1X9MAH5_9BACI|nr:ABC transporter substrate-binding protein [Halalkalibacter krulwichiae]ARK30435.1 Putative thiamine biosynthesis protein [Halalkalibacter krulwichiae]
MKKWVRFASASVILASLVACGDGEQQEEAEGMEQPIVEEELAQVDIMLDWYPNAVHSYLYVAQEKGYFEEEGVEVTIQFPANPTDPINLAAAGQVTLGISYQPDVVIARATQDVPVKSIGAIVRSPLNHVVFMEDSEIQTPKDLEGKKVGFPGIPLNESILKTMVQNDNGDPENVQMIDVGFELGTSVVSERVDAVIGAYINHEVPVLKYNGHNTRFFNPVEYGVPSYYELVVVTSDSTWESEEESIRAFWRGATKGYQFMKENPEEALAILLSNQDEANFPLIEDVEQESLEILLPKMESENGFGNQEDVSWQETIDWMLDYELIEEAPLLEDIFVNIVE